MDIFRRVLAAENGKAALAALLRYAAFVGDRVEGRAELLLRQMSLRFGPVPAQVLAAADRLDVWGEHVLTAANLDEVLG